MAYTGSFINPTGGYTLPQNLYTGGTASAQSSCPEGVPWFQCQWQQAQDGSGGGTTVPAPPQAAYDWLKAMQAGGPVYTPAPPRPASQLQNQQQLFADRMSQMRGLLG